MATYKNIRVKKSNGGFRTQRAMVLANGKLKFVKNTGGASAPRKASHVATKTRKRKSNSKAITHRRRSYARTRRRRSGRGGGGGINMLHLGGAALGLAYLTGPKSPVPSIAANVKKIPMVGTSFTAPAAVGITALAVDRFAYRNKWLRLIGVAGIVLAAAEVGKAGKDFKVEGDDDMIADFSGDEDDEDEDYEEG